MALNTLNNKKRPIRILVIDDNHGDLLLLKRALSQSKINYEIKSVDSGEEAISLLQGINVQIEKKLPDLIFLDLNLPKMNGLKVLKTIKNDFNLKMIPVIILSSSNAKQDVIACYQAHANCYLVKGYLEELNSLIHSFEQFWFYHVVLPN